MRGGRSVRLSVASTILDEEQLRPIDSPPKARERRAASCGGRGANAPAEPPARRKRGLAPDPEARALEGGPTGPTENERRCGRGAVRSGAFQYPATTPTLAP